MAIRKPAIPTLTTYNDFNVLAALKETVEIITGARLGELTQLATTATTAEIIVKVNEIIVRLNASGK